MKRAALLIVIGALIAMIPGLPLFAVLIAVQVLNGALLPVMLFFGFTSNLLYATMGSLLRDWLQKGARLLWFNRFMAAVLAITAAWMATF